MFEDDVRREFIVLQKTGAAQAGELSLDSAPPLPPPLVNHAADENKK